MKFEIEIIDCSTISRVQSIALKTWPDTFKNILSEAQIKYMLDWMYNTETLSNQVLKGHYFVILKSNGLDLGFIGFQSNYPENNISKIHKIYVLPEAQGLGVGKKLIEYTEDFLKNTATTSLLLNVNRYNSATEFYKKLGFKIIKEENIDIGNGYFMEDFVMEKNIN
ncbi:MAG: GNAT family N-acetyltransferase [Flavobacteriia bacterium]|nr:GNAT family N-acetyltransferase [Flavobacteriia bacterium]